MKYIGLGLVLWSQVASAQYTTFTAAGGGNGDGGFAYNMSAGFRGPVAAPRGKLYIADAVDRSIRAVNWESAGGLVSTVPLTAGAFKNPIDVAEHDGDLYVLDVQANRIYLVTMSGITPVVGTGAVGDSGDGTLAIHATLNAPSSIIFDDRTHTLYIADINNRMIRSVYQGIITTVAGGLFNINDQDEVPATESSLNYPYDMWIDPDGTVTITTTGKIRQVTPDGIIHTLAEILPIAPLGDIVKIGYTFYVAGQTNGVIYQVQPDGSYSIFAGSYGQPGRISGDGGPPANAVLGGVYKLTTDGVNLYANDMSNNLVRVFTPQASWPPEGGGTCTVGDMNGDGLIAVTDVILLVNQILGAGA